MTSTGSLLDLVVAYDVTGALGGREWIEEHADPAELRAALQAILGNVFPKDMAALAWTVLNRTINLSVGELTQPKPTNGSGTPGVLRPNRSERRSTRSK